MIYGISLSGLITFNNLNLLAHQKNFHCFNGWSGSDAGPPSVANRRVDLGRKQNGSDDE
jgi:hypothetical protein